MQKYLPHTGKIIFLIFTYFYTYNLLLTIGILAPYLFFVSYFIYIVTFVITFLWGLALFSKKYKLFIKIAGIVYFLLLPISYVIFLVSLYSVDFKYKQSEKSLDNGLFGIVYSSYDTKFACNPKTFPIYHKIIFPNDCITDAKYLSGTLNFSRVLDENNKPVPYDIPLVTKENAKISLDSTVVHVDSSGYYEAELEQGVYDVKFQYKGEFYCPNDTSLSRKNDICRLNVYSTKPNNANLVIYLASEN